MIIYLIKSTLSLSAFLLVYYVVFERENMHVFKRFYLLFSLAFSFIVPFISFEFQGKNAIAVASNSVQAVILPTLEISTKTNYFPTLIYFLYGIITFLFAIRFFRNLYEIRKTKKNAEIITYENAELALTNEHILPHTFGTTIFINKQSYDSKLLESELFTHELTHVRQKHTLDVLLIEILKTIFWFNPLLILYKRAIQLNHEFLADERVIRSHENILTYQKLLLSKSIQPSNFYLTSNLTSFLKTKKRFIMMTKTTSIKMQLIKKLIVAPLFFAILIFGSSMTFAQEVPTQEKPIKEDDVDPKLYQEYLKKHNQAKANESKTNLYEQDPIYSSVEKRPEYPGGMQAFYNFVGQNFNMPDINGLNGKVFIQFVIEKDGSLTDIKIMRDIGHGTGEEAVRVIKLAANWIPGEQDGKKVRTLYSLPITISGN